MTWRRNLTALLVLAGLAGGAWWVWTTYLQKQEQPPGEFGGFAMPVDAAEVRRDLVLRSVEAVGTLRANEQVTLRPEIAGYVEEITFNEGESVTAGTVLIKIDDEILQAELTQAEASFALSQQNYERADRLQQQGSGTTRARDEALAELRTNEAILALARTRVRKTLIAAPFAGILGLREVSVGEYVSVGEALVTLQDIETIKVDFRVPELYLAEVRLGQELGVRVDALPAETFSGTVYAIDPQVDINGRALVIRATLPNRTGALRPGLFARVDLILERHENALLIPEAALVPTKDGNFVYRVVEGTATLTPVKIGIRQGAEIEILDGLSDGDVVVTGGQLKLQDGMPVSLPDAAPAAGSGG